MIIKDITSLKFSIVNDSDIPVLLKAISKSFEERKFNEKEKFNTKNWYWQYKHVPTKKSFYYAAWIDQEIIGYYHVVTYNFIAKNNNYIIGNILDVAILKEFRGQGIFQKLSEFANVDINKHVDILYTFPNKKSINAFLKYDKFDLIASLPIYLLPLEIDKIINTKFNLYGLEKIIGLPFKIFSRSKKSKLDNGDQLVLFNEFDKRIANVFKKFTKLHSLYILRDKEFLNWRYVDSPKGKFYYIGLKKDNELTAIIVVKNEKIFKNEALIVLDFAFSLDVKDLQKLISNFHSVLIKNYTITPNFILLSGLSPFMTDIIKCGFISIPKFLIPRKLKLLARLTGRSSKIDYMNYLFWLITLGDWDVF